ncbi:MAG: fibronectin type III domain-containing protein [Flavobacteriales bacterium]|nr:fibronectin type III domain-containing protein [Flavobacteriales bacterium]
MSTSIRSLLLAFALAAVQLTSVAQTLGQNKSVRMWAVAQSSPPRITLNWLTHTNTTGYTVYRKLKGGTSWGTAITTLGASATQYADNTVAVNTNYEYKVVRTTSNLGSGYGYVNAGIELAMVENRGKVVLLVDNTFTTSLTTQLAQLQQDLEGDGWKVLRHDVSRTAPVTSVKALVLAAYNADPANVKAVLNIGHVPVPMSGNLAPDGHGEHYGAWAADVYYGEVNGSWTDNSVNSTSASWARNHNVPGDGKFDQTVIPTAVELAVGRVDFYDLPSFSQSETTLLGNYLTKLHQWKVKQFTAQDRAVVDDNFTGFSDAFSQNAWRGFGPLVHPNNTIAGDYFTELVAQTHLWSYGCGGGWWTNANGVGTTAQFASSTPQGIFTVLFGSYFGDWDYQDNFLRAALASGKTLTNFWAGYPNWYFHHMGMGETIGYATTLTQNNGNGHYEPGNPSPGRVHIALLGDPTLRMHVVAPPTNVLASSSNGSSTTVTWTASPEPGLVGYHVYRLNTATQTWERRTTSAVTGLSFVDNTTGLSGTVRYMVRALKLQVSYSGSYYNLSLGAFGQVTLNTVVTDCLGVAGGSALPGTPCNDNNACTTGDTWGASCQCIGTASADSDGDGVCNAQDGCPNDANKIAPGQCGCGNLEPGSPCNDGNGSTINDVVTASCTCVGQTVDCLGVPGGSALPGSACNDNNAVTGNDTWSPACQCVGQLIDCLGVVGGLALPGAGCNDGNSLTTNDVWSPNCTCAGTPVDCLGVPGGSALPGSPCNDNNASTGNDIWSASCQCMGQVIDCNGVPGGGAVVDLCGVCGGNNGCVDVNVCYTLQGPTNPDGEEAENGNIYNNTGALDLVHDSETNPWRGDQIAALHYMDLDIPVGATIVSAYMQFTSRGTSGTNPCALQVSLQASDDAPSLGWTAFNYGVRPRTSSVAWSPALWPTANQATAAQRTPNLAAILQEVIDRPGWAEGNNVAVFLEGTGRRSSWSWDQDPARAAQLCVSYALPALDCVGVPGGAAQPGTPCDDGNASTGGDVWSNGCECIGLPLDCAGVPGGSALPGSACDDGDLTTGNDVLGGDCICAGELLDCSGVPGGPGLPGAPCDDENLNTVNDTWSPLCSCEGIPIDCNGVVGGPDLPGAPCDDDDPLTTEDTWSAQCACVGLTADCLGVPGGSALPGSSCDDGDPATGSDTWSIDCTCVGLLIDCNGVPGGTVLPGTACDDGFALTENDTLGSDCLCAGVPTGIDCEGTTSGSALPGTPCDDGDESTGDDTWTNACNCAGLPLDCTGIPGGSIQPGTPCDDDDAGTGDDVYGNDCVCAGQLIDCEGVIGGSALPGSGCDDGEATTGDDRWGVDCVCAGPPLDCLGVPGGSALSGSACDDQDEATGNDVWTADCTCAGELIDCEGVSGGGALPGAPCDDGDPATGDDAWTSDCTCVGLLIDCAGIAGGGGLPGVPCDDGNAQTGDDRWGMDCVCAGLLLDCEGIPGGTSLVGLSCDDGNAATGDDVWTVDCECAGLLIDCMGVPGGSATINTPCDDGDVFTGDDRWNSACECAGLLIDCEGTPGAVRSREHRATTVIRTPWRIRGRTDVIAWVWSRIVPVFRAEINYREPLAMTWIRSRETINGTPAANVQDC